MSYLLDKKIRRKNFFYAALGIVFLIVLFYFRFGIFNGLSKVSQIFFRPVLIIGNNLGDKFKNLGAYFLSKNSLYLQNQNLQMEVEENSARIANYDSIAADNANLKEILNRKDSKINMVLSAILSKPNQSVYDTLLIDAGIRQGIKKGNIVFALGNVPVGRIDVAYDSSSKVVLFSNAGEKTQVVVTDKNIFMELAGRGGGNFEMILPRDFILQEGDQVVLPGPHSYVLAVVETIISDPRDLFAKALLTSPVNIQELKFVQVEAR